MIETGRGKLKVFLGYAAGIGKTYKMLEEAQALRTQGRDVVIGYFEPHGRIDTIRKTEGLETIPEKRSPTAAPSSRKWTPMQSWPDGHRSAWSMSLPTPTSPGSERAKRWEDIEALRNGGIHVLTTMNIQHLESLNDQVREITGVRVAETIPDWVLQQADELVMVDLTPRALLHRLERGVVYSREKAEWARKNFFRESNLVALRELALRETVHALEHRVVAASGLAPGEDTNSLQMRPKILLLVTEDPQTAMLIRRARRMSDFLEAECFAVVVQPSGDLSRMEDAVRDRIERHLNFARNLRIETAFSRERTSPPPSSISPAVIR